MMVFVRFLIIIVLPRLVCRPNTHKLIIVGERGSSVDVKKTKQHDACLYRKRRYMEQNTK